MTSSTNIKHGISKTESLENNLKHIQENGLMKHMKHIYTIYTPIHTKKEKRKKKKEKKHTYTQHTLDGSDLNQQGIQT